MSNEQVKPDGKTTALAVPNQEFRSIQWGRPPRLAEVGKIKIGGKGEERKSASGGTYRLPKWTDHFVVTTMERDRNGDFIPNKAIMEKLGQNCKELEIMLLYDDIDLNFPTYYAYYKGRTCWCRGNGVVAKRSNDKGGFTETKCTCPFIEPDEKGVSRCGPHAILSAVLRESDVVGGVYAFRTGSWYSIQNIRSALMFIKTLTNGVLARIPLKLVLQMQTVQSKAGAKTVPICTVIFKGEHEKLYEQALKIAQLRNQYAGQIQKLEDDRKLFIESNESLEEGVDAIDVTQEYQPSNQEGVKAQDVQPQLPGDETREKIEACLSKIDLPDEVKAAIKKSVKNPDELLSKLEKMVTEIEAKPKSRKAKVDVSKPIL